jgi:hypothetical protein
MLTEVRQQAVEGLALDDCQHALAVQQCVVTGGQTAAFGGQAAEAPGVALVAGDPHPRVCRRLRTVQPDTPRPTLGHGRLGEPEDLLIRGWLAWCRLLVALLDDLEVAALLAGAVQNGGQSLAVALERHDRHALDDIADVDRAGGALLAQAEDVLIGARPPLANQQRQHRIGLLVPIDSQAVGELRVAAPLDHPHPNL